MADKVPLATAEAVPEQATGEIDFSKSSPIPDTFNRYVVCLCMCQIVMNIMLTMGIIFGKDLICVAVPFDAPTLIFRIASAAKAIAKSVALNKKVFAAKLSLMIKCAVWSSTMPWSA